MGLCKESIYWIPAKPSSNLTQLTHPQQYQPIVQTQTLTHTQTLTPTYQPCASQMLEQLCVSPQLSHTTFDLHHWKGCSCVYLGLQSLICLFLSAF